MELKGKYGSKLKNVKIVNDVMYEGDKVYSQDINKDLKKEWLSVLSGRDKLYFHIKDKYSNITRKDCMDFLKNNGTSIIHKVPEKPKVYKPIISHAKNERWQCDFIIMSPIRRYNVVFVLIDCCTKYCWTWPLFGRGQDVLVQKIRPLFMEHKPSILQCDNEFRSDVLKAMC